MANSSHLYFFGVLLCLQIPRHAQCLGTEGYEFKWGAGTRKSGSRCHRSGKKDEGGNGPFNKTKIIENGGAAYLHLLSHRLVIQLLIFVFHVEGLGTAISVSEPLFQNESQRAVRRRR